jgi:hypothetical protein
MEIEALRAKLLSAVEGSRPRLEAISEQEAGQPLKPSGWSRKQTLGHLIDSASNNHQRFVRCLLEGGLAGWPSYKQDAWVETGHYQEAPWAGLVEFWCGYNRVLERILRHASAEKLKLRCQVGESDQSLGEVAEMYVKHMEHHLEQILS